MPEELVNNKNLELYIFKPFMLYDPELKRTKLEKYSP